MLRPVLVLALSASLLPAQLIQLQPIADVTTNSSQPAANFGADVELNIGKDGTSNPSATWFLRGHIQFDLTPYVPLGRPQRARLFWYQLRASGAGCLDVTLHRALVPWSEMTVTWSSQPAIDTVVSGTACVGDTFSNTWKQFDVTQLVQDQVNGVHPNFGMVIRDRMEITAGARRPGFGHSRESSQVTLRPYLELDYSSSFGAGCATAGPVPVAVFAGGAPRVGSSFLIQTSNLIPGSLPGTALGLSNTQWGAVPLPLGLGVYGFPGCNLLVSPDTIVTFAPLVQSTFDLTLSVPNNTALAGLAVFLQNVAFGPGGTFHLSNGIGVRIY